MVEYVFSQKPSEHVSENLKLADKSKKMLPKEHLYKLLKDADSSLSEEPIVYGLLEDMREEDWEALSHVKFFVFKGAVCVTNPSGPHESMVRMFTHALWNAVGQFCPQIVGCNESVEIYGKFSCGALTAKHPDFALRKSAHPGASVPLVGEVAFTHENLYLLMVQAGEILSEGTDVTYSISALLRPSRPFHLTILLLRRILDTNQNLAASLRNHSVRGPMDCTIIQRGLSIQQMAQEMDIEIVNQYVITEDNIAGDFQLEINGRLFLGYPHDFLRIIITREALMYVWEEWDAYLRARE